MKKEMRPFFGPLNSAGRPSKFELRIAELESCLREAVQMTDDAWSQMTTGERKTLTPIIERWRAALSIAGDRAEHMKHGIKGAYPEAFK